tara:strand:- start:17726 stop:17845 length:120 start_codon:yes stop_codon:yes gene_type:complete
MSIFAAMKAHAKFEASVFFLAQILKTQARKRHQQMKRRA